MPRRSARSSWRRSACPQTGKRLHEYLHVVLLVGYARFLDLEITGRETGHRLLEEKHGRLHEGVLQFDLYL